MAWYLPFNLGTLFGQRTPIELDAPGAAQANPVAPAADGAPRTAGQASSYGVAGVAAWADSMCCPSAPPGYYLVWRAMDADPALTLSRAVVTAPVREADKSYEAREGTPDAWVKLVQDSIDPLWPEMLAEALDCLSMGWKPFEVVYGRRAGRTAIVDLKPLAQELTTVLTRQGAFAGLRNSAGIGNKQVDLTAAASFVVTVGGLNRNVYGRPWHENARKAWWEKIQCLVALAKLNKKASGIQPTIYYPPAADEEANATNFTKAKAILTAYMAGDGVAIPNAAGSLTPDMLADHRNITGMAEAALWRITVEDHGNTGGQAAAILDQIRYHNAELSRAWHVPERAAQEAVTAGSRADSETGADTALRMSQLVYNGICDALTRGPVDTLLLENFGEAARGAVKVMPGKLSDVFADGDWRLIDAVLSQPDLFAAVSEQVDLDAIFTRRGIPKNKATLTLTDAIKQRRAERERQPTQMLDNDGVAGRINGNGSVNGNGRLAMARGVRLLGDILGGEDGHAE